MNNYDNAEPKPLKFLVSDGKLVDESGNVIAESDSLQDLYIKSSPQVKKYLLSDGSVVDENNNLIIKNDYYKKVYDQATPKIAKYLHSDGTIDENPGSGSGADLEDNHQTTIDVSTYTEPVEITPTAGKDGMKKATVTLDNIPSGGSATAYCWVTDREDVSQKIYLEIDNGTMISDSGTVKGFPADYLEVMNNLGSILGCELISISNKTNNSFQVHARTRTSGSVEEMFILTRDSSKDITLW